MTEKLECLVAVFVSTSGASGEELGADEKELVQLVWQVVDMESNTVSLNDPSLKKCVCVCVQLLRVTDCVWNEIKCFSWQTGEINEIVVRPELEDLDPDILQQAGLTAQQIQVAEPLEQAIKQVRLSDGIKRATSKVTKTTALSYR